MALNKKSKHRSDGTAPADPRLATGEVIIVDADVAGRAALKASVARASARPEVRALADLEGLKRYIHPHSTGRAGRPPVRGFMLDWGQGSSGSAALLELLKWLDRVYPRTPVVTYTGAADLSEIRRRCAAEAHAIQTLKPAPVRHLLGHAALACVQRAQTKIVVFARDRLSDAVLRSLDEVCFMPWDAQRLESRLWLLAQLWPYRTKDPTELHMRTIEAYLEAVPYERLCAARGVGSATMTQHQKDVGDIWGAPIDSLKQRFELHRQGRGAGTPAFLDETMWAPDETAPTDGARPTRPPHPRRPSARRSR